jgi:Alpha-kinase family
MSGKKMVKSNLVIMEEDEGDSSSMVLETGRPHWNRPEWLDETLIMEGFSPEVVVHGARTLNDMMANDDNIKMSITELTIHKRSRPFAEGSMRVAYYARTAYSTNKFVVKTQKKGGKLLAHLVEDMKCQAMCKAFALEFNALVGEKYSIDFIVTTCFKGKSVTVSGDECLSLEPYIEGPYIKYNSNSGYVNEDIPYSKANQAAQAFSHFTFERSQGQFLVCDLQGVGNVLTDPAIHTLDENRFKLVDVNLGTEGFKFFFATHKCNAVCAKLALRTNASMVLRSRYFFRESWPSMENTVCCSNKLCGKIVQVASAKRLDDFPGCYWCNGCWPQLDASKSRWICVADGPHHEFDVSKFFFESQGRLVPRKCISHREADVSATISRSALVGSNLWAKLKSATKKSPMSRKLSRRGDRGAGGSTVATYLST